MYLDPWEHLLGMGLGSIAVNQLVKWEVKLDEDLDKMLEKVKAANERRYFGNVFVCFVCSFLRKIGFLWLFVLVCAVN